MGQARVHVTVEAETVNTPQHSHLRLYLGGVTYTAEGCNLDQTKEEPSRPDAIDMPECEREVHAFREVRDQQTTMMRDPA